MAADPTGAVCKAYAASASDARTPISAMREQAVLGPFIAVIELAPRQVAQQGASAGDPAVAAAMAELAAAIDGLDAQAKAALPPGADATATPVRIDPTRLAAALDAADKACASRTPTSVPPTR